jgi:ubiquinone/menaquinone biosynthesis C-methylase UbiE
MGESILDVACGTGWLTMPASQAVEPTGHINSIDIAPQMIALAQAKAVAANVHNIEFSVMKGQNPEFDDEQFDVITCGLALFAFPDIK